LVDSLEKTSRETFKYTSEDGFAQAHVLFHLATKMPFVLEFEEAGQAFYFDTTFSLTRREDAEMETLITPLAYFEQYGHILPPAVREPQRRLLLQPILELLSRVPAVRRSKTS
jgi:hypothetical protein